MNPYRNTSESPAAPPPPPAPVAYRIKARFRPWRRIGLMFAVLGLLAWTVFSAIERIHPGKAPFSPEAATAVFMLVFTLVWLAVFKFFRRRALHLARANSEANALLGAGRLSEARAVYEDLARRAGNMHSLRAIFLTNLGVTLVRQGDPDQAILHLDAAYRSGWLDKPNAVLPNHTVLLSALALANILRNDFDAAGRWLALAQRDLPDVRKGMLTFTRTVLQARMGELSEALRDSSAQWSAAEASLASFQMRALRVLRAYVLTAATERGLPELPKDPEAEVTTLLAGARPSKPGEFDYLSREWPAFNDFLVAKGFGA